MSVEGGGGIGMGGGVGVASVSGPASTGFEVAPNLGGIKSFGSVYESVSYSPIDRTIGKGDLENMAIFRFDQPLLKLAPLKEDVPDVSVIEPKAIVTDPAETFAKEIWSDLTNQGSLTTVVLERAQISPSIGVFEQTNTAPQETNYQYLGTPRSQERVAQQFSKEQQYTSKGVESPGVFKEEIRNQSPQEKDEVNVEKRRLVRDGRALIRRIEDGIEAIKRVFTASAASTNPNKEKVSGRDVQIPNEYDEVRSTGLKQERENVPDGGYEKYRQSAKAKIANLTSPTDIARVLEEEAYANEPVKRDEGDGGKRVGRHAVFNAFKYASKIPPIEEFRIRISKKVDGLVETEGKSGSSEKTIHEYPDLAEALQAA